jgi:hypothetical protein
MAKNVLLKVIVTFCAGVSVVFRFVKNGYVVLAAKKTVCTMKFVVVTVNVASVDSMSCAKLVLLAHV